MRKFLLTLGVLSMICTLSLKSVSAQENLILPWDELVVNYYAPITAYDYAVSEVVMQQELRHFQDARAPRFLLVDQEGSFAMGIGGFVRAVSGNEFGGIIDTQTDQGFQPSLIGMPQGDFPKSQYRLSAGTSQLFLKMVGRTRALGDISVYLSANFQGDDYAPQLRLAYAKFMGFTVGQTWNMITDLASTPPTIDYASPAGWSGFINPTIRYEHMMAQEAMQFGVSADFPTVNATWYNKAESSLQAVPDFTGYLQVNFNRGASGHMRAAALIRTMSYDNMYVDKYKNNTGWGVQLSGTNKLARKLNLYYRWIYGEGIASYINDLSTQNLDLVPGDDGTMSAIPMWGMLGGLQYNFCKNMFASATYSQTRIYPNDNYIPDDMLRYTQYISTNIFWSVTKDMQLAIEYLHGTRKNQSLDLASANRINLMAQYNF